MRQKGFGLVEMMIALVLGMIVIGAALGAYIGTFGANSTQIKYSRLNNELRMVMTQITRDLRRAGYRPGTNSDTSYAPSPVLTGCASANAGCNAINGVTYSPDAALETYAYKYEVVGGVGVISSSTDGGANWSRLTDPGVIRIPANGVSISRINADVPGDHCVRVPIYTISITGQLVRDATIVRSLQETVRPRNLVVSSNATCI